MNVITEFLPSLALLTTKHNHKVFILGCSMTIPTGWQLWAWTSCLYKIPFEVRKCNYFVKVKYYHLVGYQSCSFQRRPLRTIFKYIINKSCTTAINIDHSLNKPTLTKLTFKSEYNHTFLAPVTRVYTLLQGSLPKEEKESHPRNSLYRILYLVPMMADWQPLNNECLNDTSSMSNKIYLKKFRFRSLLTLRNCFLIKQIDPPHQQESSLAFCEHLIKYDLIGRDQNLKRSPCQTI